MNKIFSILHARAYSHATEDLDKVKKALWILKGKRIAVLGLAFKPETDDIREASSIRIIRELEREGARLRLYDPKAMDNMKGLFPAENRLIYCADPYAVAESANALLLVTEWDEFKRIRPDDFLREILSAEINYAKTKRFWD